MTCAGLPYVSGNAHVSECQGKVYHGGRAALPTGDGSRIVKKKGDYEYIHDNHSKIPIEERTKKLEVAKLFQRECAKNLERIKSTEGIVLRMNRSIQAEGVFAQIKAGDIDAFLREGMRMSWVRLFCLYWHTTSSNCTKRYRAARWSGIRRRRK